MTYLKLRALRTKYPDEGFQSAFARLYALRDLYLHATRSPEFAAPEEALAAIRLTEDGEKLLCGALTKHTGLSERERLFLTFPLMFHESLFVDVMASDAPKLAAALQSCINRGLIQYPWLFDHVLYDTAFSLFPERPEKLGADQTMRLLKGTPPGVFQVSQTTVGPYGVLNSEESRLLPPRADLLLWHCADQSCSAAHVSILGQPDTKYTDAYRTVRGILNRQSHMSEWATFAKRIITNDNWYDDLSWVNLPWFLGDAFSGPELRILLGNLSGGICRVLWAHDPPVKELASRIKSAAFTEGAPLTKPEVLQLLLLLTDQEIVPEIDDLIERKAIYIPPLETRALRSYVPVRNWVGGAHCQASSRGLRVVPYGWPACGLARLKRLIMAVYKKENEEEVLAWNLRGSRGTTLETQLERYINEFDPEAVLRNLIFVSPKKVRTSLDLLRASHLRVPRSPGEDRRLIERMLWKLGFSRARTGSPIQTFYKRLQNFRQISRGKYPPAEPGALFGEPLKAAIRGR